MAIQFHPNINNLMVGAISRQLGTCAISIYSGTQPLANDVNSSWLTYNSSQSIFLAHYQGAIFTLVSEGSIATLTTIPGATNALHTGTGKWAILWKGNPSISVLGSSTIPYNTFIVVPVSVAGGGGVIKFSDVSFVASSSKTISGGTFSSTF